MTTIPTTSYILTVSLAGAYLPEGDSVQPFEATEHDAIAAMLDEADFQLDAIHYDDEDEAVVSDLAYVEALRGAEGFNDLRFTLETQGEVSIHLASFSNSFGGVITLARTVED